MVFIAHAFAGNDPINHDDTNGLGEPGPISVRFHRGQEEARFRAQEGNVYGRNCDGCFGGERTWYMKALGGGIRTLTPGGGQEPGIKHDGAAEALPKPLDTVTSPVAVIQALSPAVDRSLRATEMITNMAKKVSDVLPQGSYAQATRIGERAAKAGKVLGVVNGTIETTYGIMQGDPRETINGAITLGTTFIPGPVTSLVADTVLKETFNRTYDMQNQQFDSPLFVDTRTGNFTLSKAAYAIFGNSIGGFKGFLCGGPAGAFQCK